MAIPDQLAAIQANLADLNAEVSKAVAALQASNPAGLETTLSDIATNIASAAASLKAAIPA